MSTIQTKEFKLDSGREMKINVETYTSAQEMVMHGKTRTRTSNEFHDMKDPGQVDKHFTSVNNYEEALDLLKNGYQPTVEKLNEALKVASKKIVGNEKRIKFENNIFGFAPIVPLALKGVPNSMINTTMKPIKCKVINVYYDMTTNCGTSTEEIIRNGQKILGAIIALEKQGYKFNLYAVQTYWGGKTGDMVCIKVKSSDKPIDLKRMSFPLTHPAFFRVIGFDWYSKFPIGKYRFGYGHAIAYDLNAKERKDFGEKMFGQGAVYLSIKNVNEETDQTLKEVFTNDKN